MSEPAEFPRHVRTGRVCVVAASIVSCLLAVGSVLYAGCAASSQTGWESPLLRKIEIIGAHASLRKPAPPESEWNASGVWVKVSNEPARYVPRAYGRKTRTGAADGRWYRDERDGKQ